MVRLLAAASLLLVSSLAVLAGDDAIAFARDKAGKEVAIHANKKVLTHLKLEKFVLVDAEKPVQLTVTCIITRLKGEDEDFHYTAYDADDVVLAKKKLGTREETTTNLNEKTPITLRVPNTTVKIRFTTGL